MDVYGRRRINEWRLNNGVVQPDRGRKPRVHGVASERCLQPDCAASAPESAPVVDTAAVTLTASCEISRLDRAAVIVAG